MTPKQQKTMADEYRELSTLTAEFYEKHHTLPPAYQDFIIEIVRQPRGYLLYFSFLAVRSPPCLQAIRKLLQYTEESGDENRDPGHPGSRGPIPEPVIQPHDVHLRPELIKDYQ